MEKSKINRRGFLTAGALATTAMAIAPMEFVKGNGKITEEDRFTANDKSSIAKRKLGKLEVSSIGLGCMSMTSNSYNPPRDKNAMVKVIRGAVDLGITFLDTAEVYGPYTSEEYVGEALKPIRNKVILASKLGFKLENGKRTGRDSRPESIRKALEGMLSRLQTDRIDLLYLHRVDPQVPIEDVAGTVKDLISEGKVLHFGLSEASHENIRKAHRVQSVTALQNEYSLLERVHENGTLDLCEELGIGFVPWCPVARGFLADKFNEYTRFAPESRFNDVKSFSPEGISSNMVLIDLVREWSDLKGVTPSQFSLAWLMAQKPWIVPIPGTTKLHHLKENIGAVNIRFSSAELKDFRSALEKIKVFGVRPLESASKDL
ncbi:aldo/keto reductase [Pedobacter panaciterrae]|uniref:Aldo/keto reductase n=1 Tax=Pedobacter panaciterrae TaxID=363849 RepID=A0ABU8NIL4_9SPHI